MTQDMDRIEPRCAADDEFTAAMASVDRALSALRERSERAPLPPLRLTAADRLVQ